MSVNIAPSILAADFSILGEEIRKVRPVADFLHLDVMDGHYVPNITIGVPVVESLRKVSDQIFDVHLMITNPLDYIEAFASAGADYITVHVETLENPLSALRLIRDSGKKPGLSIHPDTPIEAVFPYLSEVDLVLVMSVRPGFGGQKFMPQSCDRISAVRAELDRINNHAIVSVDGGIHKGNASDVVRAGANLLVVGSAVFGEKDPAQAVREIMSCATS
ncbi:MAG: ribulose-phosphate 3-epimerase [Clostridiaceae bacterium]|nr:ribulose-phosphate 3-epimerase [Clostridiaceae bacterium]